MADSFMIQSLAGVSVEAALRKAKQSPPVPGRPGDRASLPRGAGWSSSPTGRGTEEFGAGQSAFDSRSAGRPNARKGQSKSVQTVEICLISLIQYTHAAALR